MEGVVNRKFSASNAIKPVRVIELNWKISERQLLSLLLFAVVVCLVQLFALGDDKLGMGMGMGTGMELKNQSHTNWTALDMDGPDPLPRPFPLIICTISLLLCSGGRTITIADDSYSNYIVDSTALDPRADIPNPSLSPKGL